MSTITVPKPKATHQEKTRYSPIYAVIVLNDDVHTFPYVINCFKKVFGYPIEKCQKLAIEIHEKGKAIVWTGTLEVAELKKEQIESMGEDFDAYVKCNFPLGVELEELIN